MAIPKPLDLSRFKRTQSGMIEFAILIEQASPRRRELILKRVQFDDSDFLRKAMRKVVYFEELHLLDESVLTEILKALSSKTLAYALRDAPTQFKTELLRHLTYPQMKAVIDEEGKMLENASRHFIEGAQRTVLKIARQLEAKGKFTLELHNCPRFKSKKFTP